MESVQAKNWLVVPKSNKCITDVKVRNRCWRFSFHDYEREMIKDCQNWKSVIRLVKKLRDAKAMKDIASYYIKTLFLWKVSKNEVSYWQNKLSVIFRDMVQEFYDAVEKGNIPYYWQESNNLIENLQPTKKTLYTSILKSVLDAIDANNVEKVVAALLTHKEMTELKKSEEYNKILGKQVSAEPSLISRLPDEERIPSEDKEETHRDQSDSDRLTLLEIKLNDLSDRIITELNGLCDRITVIENKLTALEMEKVKSPDAIFSNGSGAGG